MKTKLVAILFLSTLFTVNAQNAKDILDKCNAAYNKAGGITATFTINAQDVKNKTTYSQDGQAQLKGNKFRVEVVDGVTWFDGKTQWVYDKGSDEVNISTPSGEDLAGISPSVLLSIYKVGFKLNYKGEKKENGKSVYVVELVPEKKKSEINKMSISVDKLTYLFTSLTMYNKDGMNNELIVKKMQTGVNIDNSKFSFSKKEYPKAEVVDLR